MGELEEARNEIAQLSRLAISEQAEDVRLYVARLVRKYRSVEPELAQQMELLLKNKSTRSRSPLRKASQDKPEHRALPIDDESRLSLLKTCEGDTKLAQPFMSERLEESLCQLIEERRQIERLESLGLSPTRTAIFVGAPGVGKTLTARWLATQLGVPLYILDLTAVMSSFLGRSGTNLRAALDFAKRTPCVLLLDEIDAIAKRRSDDADVGELKRLVTVMLQEVEEWNSTGLLLAATNHPELIDPALWRRFDLVVEFELPDTRSIEAAITQFLGPDYALFARWSDVLTYAFKGQSFSDIERSIKKFRRALALGIATDAELIQEFVRERVSDLARKDRIELAVMLANNSKLSQHAISKLTSVSRDTIRKHQNNKD
jgi:SpoVK/Ycf46/Vps4 family AAA+-type ATPase